MGKMRLLDDLNVTMDSDISGIASKKGEPSSDPKPDSSPIHTDKFALLKSASADTPSAKMTPLKKKILQLDEKTSVETMTSPDGSILAKLPGDSVWTTVQARPYKSERKAKKVSKEKTHAQLTDGQRKKTFVNKFVDTLSPVTDCFTKEHSPSSSSGVAESTSSDQDADPGLSQAPSSNEPDFREA